MGKENQRVMITKRLLKEGLLRLLAQKPIEKVSVTELCREAGINRATFYTHYETPRDILTEIEHEMADTFANLYRQMGPRNLQAHIEAMAQYFYDHADLLHILIRNSSDRDLALMLQRTYQNSLNISFFKNVDEEEQKLVSAYIAGGGYLLLNVWLKDGIQKTPKEIARLVTRLIPENLLQS